MAVAAATQLAVQLAIDGFGPNLRVAFVGGSHARGDARSDSDIDVFVVLDQPERDAEERFAVALKRLHERFGLGFDHCGEVFDRQTLRELLVFTRLCVGRLPTIQQLGCYQADCLLSAFRKGDIVFKFLTDPKVMVHGDTVYLSELEHIAQAYFHAFPMPRIQQAKGALEIDPTSTEFGVLREFQNALTSDRWLHTPVGVGLERWFRPRSVAPTGLDPALARPPSPRLPHHVCPLHARPLDEETSALLRAQCLAHAKGETQ